MSVCQSESINRKCTMVLGNIPRNYRRVLVMFLGNLSNSDNNNNNNNMLVDMYVTIHALLAGFVAGVISISSCSMGGS